jgi:hypothetical protein
MSDSNTTPDPHAVDPTPSAFELSADQIAFLKTLGFHTEFELTHTPKTAPDVPDAFKGTALPTIAGAAFLGGAARQADVKSLLDTHEKLTAIAAVLAPLSRLVSQNLLVTDAKLAKHVAETLKLATMKKQEQPHLLEGLAPTRTWSGTHHPGRGAAPAPTPAPTK